MDTEPDYVTVLPALTRGRALVAVMHYNHGRDDYEIRECSGTMPEGEARIMARLWAADRHLEVR